MILRSESLQHRLSSMRTSRALLLLLSMLHLSKPIVLKVRTSSTQPTTSRSLVQRLASSLARAFSQESRALTKIASTAAKPSAKYLISFLISQRWWVAEARTSAQATLIVEAAGLVLVPPSCQTYHRVVSPPIMQSGKIQAGSDQPTMQEVCPEACAVVRLV